MREHGECMSTLQPILVSLVALFFRFPLTVWCCSFLSARKFASSTILTYFSALGYVHKLSNLPDLSKNFLVQKLLMAHIRLHPAPDVRLQITFSFAPPSACFKSHQFLFFSGCFTKQCFWWLSMAFSVCMNSRPRGQT